MDWENINQINTIIGIVNGIWGIGNIVLTIKSFLVNGAKKDFLKELENERKQAEKEHSKTCKRCKAATQQTIDILRERERILERA